MIRVEIERVHGDYGFEARDAMNHTVQMDTSPETGGDNFGVRPMQSLLLALGGCSGIDIISILKKQRLRIDSFKAIIEGEREPGVEPSLWKKINVQFLLGGNMDADKAKRACQLSIEKYCSVAETLRRAGAKISWTVAVNNKEVPV
jgi:putative redox protein